MIKNPDSTNTTFQGKKSYGWVFWLWLVSLFLLALIVTVLVTAWSVRHELEGGSRFSETQSRMVIALADFPALVRTSVQQLGSWFTGDPLPLLINRKTTEQPNWLRQFPAPEDSGYLLFFGVDPAAKRADVQLIKISDGTVVARWQPDWFAIMAQTSPKKFIPAASPYTLLAIHPLLLADGDIICGVSIYLR